MTREEAKKELSKMIFELGFEDNVDDKVYALNMAIQALSQEPCKDMEEISEIMKCDADAETKCKMISNILTDKPHYFEEQEPCEDAVSREAILSKIKEVCFSKEWTQFRVDNGSRGQRDFLINYIEQLPSVTQKSGKWILTIEDWNKWTCSNCGYVKRTDIHVNIGWKYCPNCGARMESEEISERNMKMWEGIFKAESEDKE